jgi:NADPH-dependent 2,4-dienoyl-CoA reductase/sulfur reductase-like enzyme/rhodanese-related sulfurtransferase
MSAATRARRLNERASIVVLERSGHVSFSTWGSSQYVSGKIESEQLLLTTPERLARRFRIDARVRHDVRHIDRERKRVEGVDRATGAAFSLPYDKLILAPGAASILPQVPGVEASNVFLLRSVEDTQRLAAYLTDSLPVEAVVVGGGFIGLEMVEALSERGLRVTLLERAAHALPALDLEMSGWVEAELERRQVHVHVGDGLKALHLAQNGEVELVETESGRRIPTDLVLLTLDVRPQTELAKQCGLSLGISDGIKVDAQLRTSDPHIYAVGEAAELTQGMTHPATRIPLLGAANRQGRCAGEHAATGHAEEARTPFGTALVRVFGLEVGITGLGLHAARSAGYDADSVIVHASNHACHDPGATPIHLSLVYERKSGKLLGAQAVGAVGVDKRIDVLATALHFGATLSDLSRLDLAYTPHFSAGKDPLHFAAFVAQNQERGLSCTTLEPGAGAKLLDVREASETETGMLPEAVHIPLDELRDRLSELDRAQPIVVYCQHGAQGYFATRILLQHGFRDVKNLRGGYAQVSQRLQRPARLQSAGRKR